MQLSKSKVVIVGLFSMAIMPFSVYSHSTNANKVTCYVQTGAGGDFGDKKCDVFKSCKLVTKTKDFNNGAGCTVTATPFDSSSGTNGTKTITATECQTLQDTYSSCPGYVLHQQ